MIRSLNFKHIFYFWVVAKESSISKASTLVNVSRSSISEQIKILENRVGVDFFDRSQKKMTLTLNGKILFERLDKFFPSIEELFESLSNHKTSNIQFLRIGLCPGLSEDLRFKLCFPFIEDINYTVKILQGENKFLLDAFDDGEVDLIFSINKNMNPKGKSEKFLLAKKKFCIVVNPTVYKNFNRKNDLEFLGNLRFINYTSDSDLHFKVIQFFHNKNISPVRIAEIDDIALLKETIKKLDCFSVLPEGAIKSEVKNGEFKIIPISLESITASINAVYRPKFQNERFLTHLNNIFTLLN